MAAFNFFFDKVLINGVLSILALFVCTVAINVLGNKSPRGVPWVGLRDEAFARPRATFREFFNGFMILREGYSKYSKNGKSFVVPDLTFSSLTFIPQESIRWMLLQKDAVLSHFAVHHERLGIEYIMPEILHHKETVMVKALRNNITSRLDELQPIIFEELKSCIDRRMGTDEENWTEIGLFDTLELVTSRAAGRVILGPVLSHNEEFHYYSKQFNKWFGAGSAIVGYYSPKYVIRPITGRIMRLGVLYYKSKCMNYLRPLVENRWRDLQRAEDDPSFIFDVPDDLVTWSVRSAMKTNDKVVNDPEELAVELIMLIIAALPTTAITATNVFLDLAGSNPSMGYWNALREEAAATFPREHMWLDASNMPKLQHIDSAVRESMRLNPIIAQGLLRRVVDKNGITLPDGNHIPYGCIIGVASILIHRDERFYPMANEYQPFRYLEDEHVKEAESHVAAERDTAFKGVEGVKTIGLAITSDKFLTFGHGRHACPGRYLAAQVLRMTAAYVTLNYDIKPLERRPANSRVGDLNVPDIAHKISIRRRPNVYD